MGQLINYSGCVVNISSYEPIAMAVRGVEGRFDPVNSCKVCVFLCWQFRIWTARSPVVDWLMTTSESDASFCFVLLFGSLMKKGFVSLDVFVARCEEVVGDTYPVTEMGV